MKCKLQNTSKKIKSIWTDKQEALIASLKSQPLIIVSRPQQKDFQLNYKNKPLFSKVEKLSSMGVKHIEIAWDPDEKWVDLMKELHKNFPKISLGAASITSSVALEQVVKAQLSYAMTPIWDQSLQNQARKLNQVLVPGVFSPTEIFHAISFGHRILKFFPASTLGINYLQRLREPINSIPFVIAAGGIIAKDITQWLNSGYGAIALGRGLTNKKELDPLLKKWIESKSNQS
tara:strand:+ start:3875 stop:4570 length:696 start_codon:yes stop_codon:yes gene_type:complete